MKKDREIIIDRFDKYGRTSDFKDEREMIKYLKENGCSFSGIARFLNVSRQTVCQRYYRYLKSIDKKK